MTTTLMVITGLPASGKSTLAEKLLSDNPDWVRVERDLLRDQLFGHRDYAKLTADNENTVTVMQEAMAVAALKAGKSVIVSDLNLRAQYVRKWAKIAAQNGAKFEQVILDGIELDELIRRDKSRTHSVGEEFIRKSWGSFTKKGKISAVDVSKELTNTLVVEPYSNPENLPSAILVDIDGTLAQMKDRSPYDWDRVGEDEPVKAVIEAVGAAYLAGKQIIVMSGRDGSCRWLTHRWLLDHLPSGVMFHLFMRSAGDVRKDDLVKYELFNKNIRDKYHVSYVLDDRASVVAMWRNLGLSCFQVEYGNF